MQSQIQEFNEKLAKENREITIIEYVKELNIEIFNIDINFLDDFINLVDKEGYTISHEMLFKYDVLVRSETSNNVFRVLQSNNFEEGIDYMLKKERVDDGRTEKKIYMLSSDAFKMLCMRSHKTKKYANYYILLEKCIKYYDQLEKLKLQKKIEEINKIKLLKLEKSETLDNFVIIKCDEKTLHIRKFQGVEYIYNHNHVKFPYATIKGSDKNISKIIKKNNFKTENIVFCIKLPSYDNFNKKLNEMLSKNIYREKVFYNKTTKKIYFGELDEYDVDIDDEDDSYSVAVTKFFNIIAMTEKEFIEKVKQIDLLRFVH